jgi:replication factor C subunit 3/5
MNTLLQTKDVITCLQTINTLKATQGLALADIITALAEELSKMDVPAPVMITWLDGLAEVEYRLSGGGGELVQTGAVVGVVRNGAELLGEVKS